MDYKKRFEDERNRLLRTEQNVYWGLRSVALAFVEGIFEARKMGNIKSDGECVKQIREILAVLEELQTEKS